MISPEIVVQSFFIWRIIRGTQLERLECWPTRNWPSPFKSLFLWVENWLHLPWPVIRVWRSTSWKPSSLFFESEDATCFRITRHLEFHFCTLDGRQGRRNQREFIVLGRDGRRRKYWLIWRSRLPPQQTISKKEFSFIICLSCSSIHCVTKRPSQVSIHKTYILILSLTTHKNRIYNYTECSQKHDSPRIFLLPVIPDSLVIEIQHYVVLNLNVLSLWKLHVVTKSLEIMKSVW